MHCVLIRVCKSLLGLWFDSGDKTAGYQISSCVSEVDARLTSIKPPHSISRVPRSIEHHPKYLMASELRSFLLFYGPTVLYNILPKPYYEHFLLLSKALFFSYKILSVKLNYNSLNAYCFTFVSCLRVMVDDVRALGPFYGHIPAFILKTRMGSF